MARWTRTHGKAIAATVGAGAELAVQTLAPHTTAWNVAAAVVAVLTVFGVYQTRNTPKPPEGVTGQYVGK